jgi:glucose/mannose-6-phosphate isomerase
MVKENMAPKPLARRILDDKDAILALDQSHSFMDELAFSENLKKAVKNAKAFDLPEKIKIGRHIITYANADKVVFSGMGGSAIAGDVVKDWAEGETRFPMEVVRSYHLPTYIDNNTLVFLISYSGNTEETLSCMLEAIKKGCKIICISSDGVMQKAVQALNLPIIGLPKMAAARVSFPYLLAPLPYLMAKMGVLSLDKVEKEMGEARYMVSKLTRQYAIEAPYEKNFTKKVAFQILGTIPVIYSYNQYRSVGLRFKTQVNENCKLPARCDVFPELDHNEIMGWEASRQILRHYTLLLLRGPEEPREVKTRIEVLKKRFFNKARSIIEIKAQGETTLARIFSLLFTADMISLYLSVLLRRDPVASQTFKILKYQMTERLGTLEKLEQRIRKLGQA